MGTPWRAVGTMPWGCPSIGSHKRAGAVKTTGEGASL
jgi:hypothetical protein